MQTNSHLDHVFLWDAAMPATALSSNERQQLLDNETDRFCNASDAAKHITVLYNHHDNILQNWYTLAKTAAKDYSGDQHHMGLWKTLLASVSDGANATMQAHNPQMTQQTLQLLQQQQRCMSMLQHQDHDATFEHTFSQTCAHLHAQLQMHTAAAAVPALGLLGVEGEAKAHDPLVLKMISTGKLAPADMSPYATGHSYMKIPSPDVMKYGYQYYIINKTRGVKGFGSYDKSAFPDPKQG